MALQTDFRNALASAIEEILDITIVEGVLTGPQVRDIGCCFIHGGREDSNVVRERLDARVRIFLNNSARQPTQEKPLSMQPLEDIVERVQVGLSARSQSLGGTWFARLTEWEYDPNQYGVELAFLSVGWNQWEVVHPSS